MKFEIMITGINRKIVSSDISKLLEKELNCTVIECQPLKSQLLDLLFTERPNVVLIFIKDESQSDIKVYDVIKEYDTLRSVTVIVVSNETDRKMFIRNSQLRKILFLPHDISLSSLCDRLNEIKEDITAEDEKSQFIEFDSPNANESESTKKNILVVDDDAQQLIQIKEHLRDFYDVALINSGKQVIRYLEKFRTDLIFLDYLMPDMTGPEVLTMIRNDGRFSNIPVVFLTGVSERETVIKTITEFKPQGYLLKPTTKIDIVTKVIEILG